MGETVLITGCSSGIGRATAAAFLDRGWTVYATARDDADLSALAERGARTARLDVTSDDAVSAAVRRAVAEAGRIDCLVNNAGYGQFGPVEDVPTERVERQFDVNVFGPHRLTRAVLPHMRERGAGRIVNVSSVDGRLPLPGVGAYCGSKSALRSMSDALRQELAGSGLDVVVIEPGLVSTRFYRRAVEEVRDLPDSSPDANPYADYYRILESLSFIDRAVVGAADPSDVAREILRAATAERPRPYYRAGSFATLGVVASEVLRGRLRDRIARRGVSLLARDGVLDLIRRTVTTDGDATRIPVGRPPG